MNEQTTITKKKFNRLIQKLNKSADVILPVENPKAIHNATSANVPTETSILLSLGPKFSLPNTSLKQKQCFHLVADVELILKTNPHVEIQNNNRCGIANIIQNHIYQIANMPTRLEPSHQFLEKARKTTNKFMKEHPNLVIVQSDKGNKTVIMQAEDYKLKMLELIKNSDIYQPLTRDPTNRWQTQNNNFVERLRSLKLIDTKTRHKLTAKNSLCPRIYGQPKSHKPGLPLRPVVPNMTAPTYNLSKFVGKIIQMSINSKYNVKDSFEFCDFINTVILPENYILVSLDVISLFTCIPKDLVCHDIIQHWDEIRPNAENINLDLFLEITDLCIEASYFMFDGKIYKQTFGTAMGNPLSPTIADLVMEELLNSVIPKLNFSLPFIKKYVDDLITAIPIDQLQHVKDTFNSYNPHIQFTHETENNNRIPYLDMMLVRQPDRQVKTEWYQKPIASGRFLDYLSMHPQHQKINVAKNFISRVQRLSTNMEEKDKIEIMDHLLQLNNYPKSLRHRLINNRNNRTTSKQPTDTTDYTYRSIAYIPTLSDKIEKYLKKDYPQIKLTTRNTSTIKQQFFTRIKDKIALEDNSNVIYSIPCDNCNSQYIGMTKNKVKTRMSGHKSNKTTLEKLKKQGLEKDDQQFTKLKEQTALLYHCIELDHTFNTENVKIIDRHRIGAALPTLEMCHIFNNSNTVNKRSDTEGLSSTYAGIFNTLHTHKQNDRTKHKTNRNHKHKT